MTKKIHSAFICSQCSYETSKWLGKCPECGHWNSFKEEEKFTKKSIVSNQSPQKIKEIEVTAYDRSETGLYEFDRVVGGGIVAGSLILIGGEPGIGKSTLLLEIVAKLSAKKMRDTFLYISGEESVSQIAARARRMCISGDNFLIYNETSWQKIKEQIIRIKPRFIVLDSIQTTISDELAAAPGSVSQIREVTFELMSLVKESGITCFVVGHITKEGTIAGPKILEHMVDTVIYFEGEQFGNYRILRAIKNRFGTTHEIGIFEMGEKGLIEIKNSSQIFLENTRIDTFGKSLTCVREGSRCLFVEIQSLVVENKFGNGKRVASGIDSNRISMMIAIVEKYLEAQMGFSDIYLNVVGNMKAISKESDLAIIAAVLSSYKAKVIKNDVLYIGEVGLTGEIREVSWLESKVKEIEMLNYKKIYTSSNNILQLKKKTKVEVVGLSKVKDLLKYI